MEQWPYPFLMLATKNENKRKQMAHIFKKEIGIEVRSLNDFPDLSEVIEDRDTFEGNACKKAEEISKQLGIPVVADDSGLVVHALGGETRHLFCAICRARM